MWMQVGAVVVGFDRYINYYKIQYATLCIRENPGCLFIATNRDAVTHLTDAQVSGSLGGGLRGGDGDVQITHPRLVWQDADRHVHIPALSPPPRSLPVPPPLSYHHSFVRVQIYTVTRCSMDASVMVEWYPFL